MYDDQYYKDMADQYRRDARRERRRAKRYAHDAAESYEWAAKWRDHARWLTQRPELWSFGSTPEHWESSERSSRKLADTLLKISFSSSRRSRNYFKLARDYERMAAA